jgi:hypothetical protein
MGDETKEKKPCRCMLILALIVAGAVVFYFYQKNKGGTNGG